MVKMKVTKEKLYRRFDTESGLPIQRENVLGSFPRTKAQCPICKKDIYVAKGQRCLGCSECRKEIREHNRRVKKMKEYDIRHGL